MTPWTALAAALALPLALAGAPAWAAPEAEGPVATAAPARDDTSAQIDAFLAEPIQIPATPPRRMDPERITPLRPHGEVSVAVGTGGYRSVYARTDIPIGDRAMLSLAVADSRFGGGRAAGRNLMLAFDGDATRTPCGPLVRPLDRPGPPGRACLPGAPD